MNAVIELEISAGPTAGTFAVHVLRSLSGGEPSAVVALDIDDVIESLPQIESGILASSVAARRVMTTRESIVQSIGVRLFDAVFTGRIGEAYRASAAVAAERGLTPQLTLRLTAPELAALPWEMLYDPEAGRYVSRKEPLVRRVSSPFSTRQAQVEAPLRILGMVSSPRGLQVLDVEAEKERLESALEEHLADGRVELVWLDDTSWGGLHSKLLRETWHVLHFIGHGGYDPESDEGLLALVGRDGRADFVPASSLADLLNEAGSAPRLVVLNSCQSGASGTTDLFSGTAATLVHSGINAVVAMQFAVSDYAALAFARSFYVALASGRRIDEAVRSGRIGILGITRDTLEWITPVLYLGSDDTRLLDPAALAPRRAAEPIAAVPAVPVVVPDPFDTVVAGFGAGLEVLDEPVPAAPAAGETAPHEPGDPVEPQTPGVGAAAAAVIDEPEPASAAAAEPDLTPASGAESVRRSSTGEEPAPAPGLEPQAGQDQAGEFAALIGALEPEPVSAPPAETPTRAGAAAAAASVADAAAPSSPIPPSRSATAPAGPRKSRRSAVLIAVGIAAAVILIGGIIWGILAQQGSGRTSSDASPSVSSEALPTTLPAVAVDVRADIDWTPTGVLCGAGDVLEITATGQLNHDASAESIVTPEGLVLPDGTPNPDYLPYNVEGLPDAATASLIGRLDSGGPFAVGSALTYTCPVLGYLLLGINDTYLEGNNGAWQATIVQTTYPPED